MVCCVEHLALWVVVVRLYYSIIFAQLCAIERATEFGMQTKDTFLFLANFLVAMVSLLCEFPQRRVNGNMQQIRGGICRGRQKEERRRIAVYIFTGLSPLLGRGCLHFVN